jgi:hypothetical protein
MANQSIITAAWAIVVLFCLIVAYPVLLIQSLLRPHSVDVYLIAVASFAFGTPLLFAALAYMIQVARTDFYRSWPFAYFWSHFTLRPRRVGWTVAGQGDSRTEGHLCSTCVNIVSRSKLLVGSRLVLTWRTEWHELNNTLDGLDPSGKSGCHFCSILWHSVPDFLRREDAVQDAICEGKLVRFRGRWNFLHRWGSRSSYPRGTKLRLKIWEELEGIRYQRYATFVRLYHGKRALCKGISMKKGWSVRRLH